MIKRVKEYFRIKKLVRRQASYSRGYQWALKELETGRLTEDEVRTYIYGCNDDFDKGAAEYLRLNCELGG